MTATYTTPTHDETGQRHARQEDGPVRTIVVAGASVAGARAADTLRQEGFDGRVVLVGAEPDPPYERPPLSKEFLRGETDQAAFTLHPADYYAEQEIETRFGRRAIRLEPRERTVLLDDGERLGYDRLLVATGASPRRLNGVPGAYLPGIHYLRDVADARALRTALAGARRVAVIGTGFIGAEVAASCRTLGREVVALEAGTAPLARALGRQVGTLLAGIHRAHGVDLRTGAAVTAFRGAGRVEQVVLASGERIDCDLVVVGIGVTPAVDWLAGSGLALDNGVVVDEHCRASLPGVYAAGDVASWWHPTLDQRLRVEHLDNAQLQGQAAARAMLGHREPYAPIPYFWSGQYDLDLQYVGHASGEDQVVLRGSVDGGAWTAFYLRDGRLRAALTVNRQRDLPAARKLIAADAPVTAAQFADETSDLKALGRSAPVAAIAPLPSVGAL